MNPETNSALERLQADLRKDGQGAYAWLDAHATDILTVFAEKGQTLTEDLVGLTRGALYAWRKSRGLLPAPGPRPPPAIPRVVERQEQETSKADPAAPAGVRPPPLWRTDPGGSTSSVDYWRGQAEAYRQMAERLLNFQQDMLAYQQKAGVAKKKEEEPT